MLKTLVWMRVASAAVRCSTAAGVERLEDQVRVVLISQCDEDELQAQQFVPHVEQLLLLCFRLVRLRYRWIRIHGRQHPTDL